MKKQMLRFAFIVLVIVVLMFSTSAAATPTTTFTLISGLPAVMHVGDRATVIVQVNSDPAYSFVSAMALQSAFYPGRGVVARGRDGIDRSGTGSSATLSITFTAIGSTAKFAGGVAPVSVVAEANYANSGIVSQAFNFNVQVP